MKKNTTTPEFEEFWLTYGRVPNSSKSDAFKAWGQVSHERPDQTLMLELCRQYNLWLEGENADRRKHNRGPHPKCHAASWLRAQKWESFMESAKRAQLQFEESAERVAAIRPEGQIALWEMLQRQIGQAQFTAWFHDAVFMNGHIVVPTPSKASLMRYRFDGHIRRIFGQETEIRSR